MLALTNDDLFVTVASKGTETDSVCHQRIGPLHETISLLKDELRDNQLTVNNLIVVMKNFTANENKCTINKEQKANVCRKGKDDVVSELLEIDELHVQPQSSSETTAISVNANQARIEQNRLNKS